jgi:hypothetical protein
MWGKGEGKEHMMMGKEHEMMMLWEKLGDSEKKMLMQRILDAKIMKKEQWIKDLQYKVETLKMIKMWIEKM